VDSIVDRKPCGSSEGKCCDRNTVKTGRQQGSFFSPSESAKSTEQPPERVGVCPGSAKGVNSRGYDFKLWRRRKDHERWIKTFVSEDKERTLLVTLTFCQFVTVCYAKEVARRVVRWLKRGVIESWVRVLERGGGGVHIHLLLRLEGELSAATGLESIAIEIRRRKRSQRIGRWQVEPVRDSGRISAYLVKTLLPENVRNRVGGRCIEYSQNIQRRPWWLEGRSS
jgi:hypothetical protein